jgi:hypothetical protein
MERTFIILGMHRSGTSCLAGILEKAGVYFGAVSKSNSFNEKGNFENKRIMKLHDDLLECSGGSWDNPPARLTWPEKLTKERGSIVDEYGHSAVWGFKDPRVLFALEGWLEALPQAELVATFRHPLAVAQSLLRRNGFPAEKSLELWARYNRRLLHYRNRASFPLLSFDLAPEAYLKKAEGLLRSLGLAGAAASGEFFNPNLRRHVVFEGELSPEAADIYQQLQRFSE